MPKHLGYRPRLDSLRAIAVAAVAWHHWMPTQTYGLPFQSGVQLFFVLSGFLITNILLEARIKSESLSSPRRDHLLISFYARRFIRIFPLYYAVLIVATSMNLSDLRATFAWHALYLSNYHLISIQGWEGSISHFWTLAVEEQFYLIWPFVVLIVPRRHLPLTFAIVAAVGFAYRQACSWFLSDVNLLNLATPGSFDSLAIGALLAFYEQFPGNIYPRLIEHRRWLYLFASCTFLSIASTAPAAWKPDALSGTMLSILFALVIFDTSREDLGGPIGRFLDFRPLQYLGKISYGLYILHNFAYIPAEWTLRFLDGPIGHFLEICPMPPRVLRGVTRLLTMATWTIALAVLSWHCYEAPINRLKRFFPYLPADPTRATDPLVDSASRCPMRPSAGPGPGPVIGEGSQR